MSSFHREKAFVTLLNERLRKERIQRSQCPECGHHLSWHNVPDREGCIVHECGCPLNFDADGVPVPALPPPSRPQTFVWPR